MDALEKLAGKVLVTVRDLTLERKTRWELLKQFPQAFVRRSAFKGVLFLEAEEDPLGMADKIKQACLDSIGRVTPLLVETESSHEAVRHSAVEVGLSHVRKGESFSFRIHKRGSHGLQSPTPDIEREIGAAILQSLYRIDMLRARVELACPDVVVVAEVLGPRTAIGIIRSHHQKALRTRETTGP